MRSDIEKLEVLFRSALEELQEIRRECQRGLELIQEHRRELLGIIEQREPGGQDLVDCVNRLEGELLAPTVACIVQHNRTFQLFLTHIIQSFAIKFEMEMHAIPERHREEVQARAEVLLHHERWHNVIGEITDICIGLLREAQGKLSDYGKASSSGQEVVACSTTKQFS